MQSVVGVFVFTIFVYIAMGMKKNVLHLVNIEGQCTCMHFKKSLRYVILTAIGKINSVLCPTKYVMQIHGNIILGACLHDGYHCRCKTVGKNRRKYAFVYKWSVLFVDRW